MNTHRQLIATLARSETFKQFARAYTATTGMPLALRPVESWQLPFSGMRQENAFCAMMAEQSRTCAACLQLQEKLTQAATDLAATRACAYGLCETAVPVKLGAQTIGFLQTGQVLRAEPTEATFRRAVAAAASRGLDIGNAATRRAYLQTPVVSQKKREAAAGLLTTFADHLALKSNQLVVQSAHTESPFITKAKRFINEHYTETLSLAQVSRAVNTSQFYFCKLFRNGTGLRFTEFISRLRVEKAKTLLGNPDSRISEITFAAGFQSLSHFGRMFRRIVGQSPTEYREQLAGGSGFQIANAAHLNRYKENRPGRTRNGSGHNHFIDDLRIPKQPPQVPYLKRAARLLPLPGPGLRMVASAR